jgi:hypothetical protein
MLDALLIEAERLLQHHVAHGRARPEQRAPHLLHPRVLAAQPRQGHGRALAHVELKVDESLGEHEHVARVQRRRKQLVGRAHEPHVQLALQHRQDLGGARVGVRHVDAALGEVEAGQGDAEGVEARELRGEDGRDGVGGGVVSIPGLVEAVEHEVRDLHIGRVLAHQAVDSDLGGGVRNTEVLNRISISSEGKHGQERGLHEESQEDDALERLHLNCQFSSCH